MDWAGSCLARLLVTCPLESTHHQCLRETSGVSGYPAGAAAELLLSSSVTAPPLILHVSLTGHCLGKVGGLVNGVMSLLLIPWELEVVEQEGPANQEDMSRDS